MYRDKPVCIIVSRAIQNVYEPDPSIESWRGPDGGETFMSCRDAREFAERHPNRDVTVWSFTLERGAVPIAHYRGGKVVEDGIAQASCYIAWLGSAIMKVVAEHLSQQSLIMDMESDPSNTAVACAEEWDGKQESLPSQSDPYGYESSGR